MPEKNETNKVRLIGEVISKFTFNHEVFGERFYFVNLSVARLSGQVDVIPVSRHDDGSNWTVPLL